MIQRAFLGLLVIGLLGFAPTTGSALAATCSSGYVPANDPAYCAATGWQVDDWTNQYQYHGGAITSFDGHSWGAFGPFGIAFDQNGTGYVASPFTGYLYRFGLKINQHAGVPDGSGNFTLGSPLNLGTQYWSADYGMNDYPAGLAFSQSYRLYVAMEISGNVDEISPSTGAIIRVVANLPTGATGLVVDPVTGDLLASDDYGAIYRITNYEGGAAGNGSPATSQYFSIGYVSGNQPTIDGMAFNPVDDTMYVADDPYLLHISAPKDAATGHLIPTGGSIDGIIRATDSSGTETDINGADGMAVPIAKGTGDPFILVNRNDGNMTMLDLNSNVGTTIVTGGTRGDFVTVGPDGCVYATQSDRIVRVSGGRLVCNFYPSSPLPVTPTLPAHMATYLTTSPVVTDYNDTATVSAKLLDSNNDGVAGVQITIRANGQTCSGTTDSTGTASCALPRTATDVAAGLPLFDSAGNYTSTSYAVTASYAGGDPYSGTDPHYVGYTDPSTGIVYPRATYLAAGKTLASGLTIQHEETIIKLQNVPIRATIGTAVTLQANLHDETGSTPDGDGDSGSGVVLVSKPITLSLGGASCSTTTDSTGVGTCSVTPVSAPVVATAAFAGDTYYKDTTDVASLTNTPMNATRIIGSATGEYNDPSTATVTLQQQINGVWAAYPNSPNPVTIVVNGTTCAGVTDANGQLACPFVPTLMTSDLHSSYVGSQGFTASYPADVNNLGASAILPATIAREETSIVVTGQEATPTGLAVRVTNGVPATLSAQLYAGGPEDTATPLSGSYLDASSWVTLTLKTNGGNSYTCAGFPTSTGSITCTTTTAINESGSVISGIVFAYFADVNTNTSDHTYLGSQSSAPAYMNPVVRTRIAGSATGEYADASTATVAVQQQVNGVWVPYPNSTSPVTVSVDGTTCTGSTDVTGQLTCPFVPTLIDSTNPLSSYVGSQTFTATLPADSGHSGASATLNATIAREETSIAVTGQQATPIGNAVVITNGVPANLSAQLSVGGPEDVATPLSGSYLNSSSLVTLTLKVNSGNVYSCSGLPSASGIVACSSSAIVNESNAGFSGTVYAHFADTTALGAAYDRTYRGSDNTAPVFLKTLDLTVSSTAATSFTRTYKWGITKTVDTPFQNTSNGTGTYNYTVGVTHDAGTDASWQVTGSITVSNPNTESVSGINLSDAVSGDAGATCTVNNGSGLTLPAGGSATAGYTCVYSIRPTSYSETGVATATWSNIGSPHTSATSSSPVTFSNPTVLDGSATVTDTLKGSLGTVNATQASPTNFTYALAFTAPVGSPWCATPTNTATFTTNTSSTTGSAGQQVIICRPGGTLSTGDLTIGFWKNSNGQGMISSSASTNGVCNLAGWLRQYAPYRDLSSAATCATTAGYVSTIMSNAGGSSMVAKLRGQMLGTALGTYFSDSSLGGNKLNLAAPIGGYVISTTQGTENMAPAFGGAQGMTILQALTYASSQSTSGGTSWYGTNTAVQTLAKDFFYDINMSQATAP